MIDDNKWFKITYTVLHSNREWVEYLTAKSNLQAKRKFIQQFSYKEILSVEKHYGNPIIKIEVPKKYEI